MAKEMWATFKKRESIVEVFEIDGVEMVRELWPIKEPREHSTTLKQSGLVKLDKQVHWTTI